MKLKVMFAYIDIFDIFCCLYKKKLHKHCCLIFLYFHSTLLLFSLFDFLIFEKNKKIVYIKK